MPFSMTLNDRQSRFYGHAFSSCTPMCCWTTRWNFEAYGDECSCVVVVYRDTGIQAIRLCLVNSSVRPSAKLLQDMEQLMSVCVSSAEDSTRTVAAACLGTMCLCVDDDPQLTTLVNSVILGIYSQPYLSAITATLSLLLLLLLLL